ncbi:MAG: metallo-beta-lactamase [Alphaproteobacteria bacterium]|nr:metallo-beta-lactamase [Alphaproteobacteria bacterium]
MSTRDHPPPINRAQFLQSGARRHATETGIPAGDTQTRLGKALTQDHAKANLRSKPPEPLRAHHGSECKIPWRPPDDPQRSEIIEPFRIIDNVYSVSAVVHDPVYLIATDEGHMLIDTSFDRFVPAIVANIEKLCFKVDDIKYLLAAHAHIDHVSGHAMMKEITGATLMAPAGDIDVIESGGKTDFRGGETWTPAKVDREIADLETLRLGNTELTAHLTPGHTKGCTTWTMVAEEAGRRYNVVFFCGMRMNPGIPLMNNPKYPQMAADFAYSFAKLKLLPVDIYLASHGYWFDFADKIAALKAGLPQAHHFPLSGVGHAPYCEDAPSFNAAITQFLADVLRT